MNSFRFTFILLVFVLFITGCTTTKVSLNEKLAQQWSNFGAARALLLARIKDPSLSLESKVISRQLWEDTIALAGDFALTKDDLENLKKSQALRIKNAKQIAIQNSKIDLERIRKNIQTAKFCSKMPKGGMLHIHPSGTLTPQTIQRLLVAKNPKLNLTNILNDINSSQSGAMLLTQEQAWIRNHNENIKYKLLSPKDRSYFERLSFLPQGQQTFARFNAVFYFIDVAISDPKSYEDAVLQFAKQAAGEGVSYVELTGRFGPETPAMLERIEAQTLLQIRVNRSFNRTDSIKDLEAKWQSTLALPKNPFLVGIDFLNNENNGSALTKGQILYGSALAAALQTKTQLHRTMHSGEMGDPRNPRDAMIMGAERIGHGVLLANDVVALEYAAKIKIPVEVNLSSNLRLTEVHQISDHPFLKYLRLGLPVSLSTDDEGMLEIDINHECEVAINQSDVTYSEMKQMAINSIETSFANDTDKISLKNKLLSSFDKFEAEQNWTR